MAFPTPSASHFPRAASVFSAEASGGVPSLETRGPGCFAGPFTPSSTSPNRAFPEGSSAGVAPAPPIAPTLSMVMARPYRMLLMAAFAESCRTFMMLEMALCARLSACISFCRFM